MGGPRSRILDHPDREIIDAELASSRSVAAVARKWGFPRKTLDDYKRRHLPPERIAVLRGLAPSELDADIERLVATGGERAVIGMARVAVKCEEMAERCEKLGDFRNGATYRNLQIKAQIEQAKWANLYPKGARTVNNNVVLSNGEALFRIFDKILDTAQTLPDARHMFAAELRQLSAPIDGEATHA